MGADKTENEGSKLELLEYGFLVEDTDPTAEFFKVYVPKLQGKTTGGGGSDKAQIDDSCFANDEDTGGGGSSSTKGYIEVRVSPETMIAHRHKIHDCPGNCINQVHTASTCHTGTSTLKPCPHFHHDHHWPHAGDPESGKIPANTRVIVLFMNHDPNDGIVTRIIADFPSGSHPSRPKDRR